jgi:hypothetical protein
MHINDEQSMKYHCSSLGQSFRRFHRPWSSKRGLVGYDRPSLALRPIGTILDLEVRCIRFDPIKKLTEPPPKALTHYGFPVVPVAS